MMEQQTQVRRYLRSRVLMIRFVSILNMLKITNHLELSSVEMEKTMLLANRQ